MRHPNNQARAVELMIGYLFGGSLLVYTANANLDLLQHTYPEPQFIGFGLFALEGGIIAWYLLHKLSGSETHKGLALFNVVICSLFSLVGFLVETLHVTGNIGPIGIPPVSYVVVGAVAYNAILTIVYKLVPYEGSIRPLPRYEPAHQYEERRTASFTDTDEMAALPTDERGEKEPGAVQSFLAGVMGPIVDRGRERLQEKKRRGRPKKKLPPLVLPEQETEGHPVESQPMNNTPETPSTS